ncbi:MAG TPA: hypothetical protein VKA34_00990 [Balneolales bacterium]|nr:hypothetical protein [Balneolales bacterium]
MKKKLKVQHKQPAVVVNSNNPMALGVIRGLGRCCIPIFAVFGTSKSNNLFHYIVKSSRFITKKYFFSEDNYESNLLECLFSIGKDLDQKAALFPVSDIDMEIISKNREKLSYYFLFKMPSHETNNMLLNKHLFYNYAIQHKISIPRTFLPEDPTEIFSIAREVRYPCIIKPSWRKANWFKIYGSKKVIIIHSIRELVQNFNRSIDLFENCIIQEIIPGDETNIFCSFTILDENSDPLCLFICKKIRQHPPHFGNTSMAQSVWNPIVADITRKVSKKLHLKGYINIEFKKDPKDATFKILEITPTRINRQAGISIAAGINIFKIWYDSLTKKELKYTDTYSLGVKWISEVAELQSFFEYLRNQEYNIFRWIKTYRNVKGFEILSKDDLLPFICVFPSYFLRLSRLL